MAIHTTQQGDTARRFTDTLRDDGAVVDLSVADSVELAIHSEDGDALFVRTATIVKAADGTVSYDPITEDIETPGDYLLQWRVTWDDGTQSRYPSKGYIKLRVQPNLDGGLPVTTPV